MSISTAEATSRRGYLSQTELAQYANISIDDSNEADDVISQAEELIDAYAGAQPKHIKFVLEGLASAGGSTSITLESLHQNSYDADYFKLCEIEIIGGTGVGQRKKITASTKAGVITVDSAWTTNPDNTSIYRIYQLGKFPRVKDVYAHSRTGTTQYYKQIPEAIKRATAAQVEYIKEMGNSFFASDASEKKSESFGDYSYTNAGESGGGVTKLIAPKAKLLLRGIKNRLGQITT